MPELTFSEIRDRIAAGTPAASLAEAEAALDLLAPRYAKAPVLIAISIAEARAFRRDDRTFWAEAERRWAFPGEKTIYHYHAVGRLLLALRDFQRTDGREAENRALASTARRCFELCLNLEFGKLAKLTVVMNDQHWGVVEVMNFLKVHYSPCTNREFCQKIDELYGRNRKARPDRGELACLPGFEDALDAVWQLEPEELIASIDSADRARQSLRAGMGLLGAALDFEKRREQPDVITLQAAKSALESEIAEIEEAIARSI